MKNCVDCGKPLSSCNCEDPEEVDERASYQCEYCGTTDPHKHALNCPDNQSPFAELIKNGYD